MRSPIHKQERFAATAIVLVAICWWVYGAHHIGSLPPESRVQFLPDDAYYYLTLARNFANQGMWSFDSGVSLTSGFHLLHAYVLAAVYSLTHASAEQFVSFGIFLSCLAAIPAVLLAAALAIRSGRLLAAMLLLLILISRNVMLNTVSVMEWSWVVSLSALYSLIFRRFWRIYQYRGLVALGLIGFLGSLARTDFGLLPAALALAALPALHSTAGTRRVKGAFVGLSGALLGVLVVLGHNYLLTGQYLQSSARMKSLWMSYYQLSPFPITLNALTLFGTPSRSTLLLVAFLALGAIISGMQHFFTPWLCACQHKGDPSASCANTADGVLWFGSVIVLVSYVAFYSLVPVGIQPWYTACLIVPIFLVVVLPFISVDFTHAGHIAVVALLLVLIGKQITIADAQFSTPIWPHQTFMLQAGNYLRRHGPEGRVGSWNSGIIGYYEGGHVVNLDGLVNNDIYEYARRNELARYIDKMGIDYILDFDNMLSSEKRRKRGGYNSRIFLDRLSPIKKFDNSSYGWRGLTLYEVRKVESGRHEQNNSRDATAQP